MIPKKRVTHSREPPFFRGSTVTTALVAVCGGQRHGSGGEFGDGEGHGAEKVAGIVGRGRNTFLVGNDELGGVHQVLRGTHQPYQGENAQRNHQSATGAVSLAISVTGIRIQGGGQAAYNGRGNIAGAAAATNGLRANGLQNANPENNRIYGFHNCGGDTALLVAGLGFGTEGGAIGTGTEDAHRAVASEQHNLLFQHGNAVEFPGLPGAEASFKNELDVEANVDGVEATIELDGINANVSPGDAGVLDTDLSRVLNDFLAEIGQEYAHVFKTVAVATGIQNAVGLYADKPGFPTLSASVPKGGTMGHTGIGHNEYLHNVLRVEIGITTPSVQGYAYAGKYDRILQKNPVIGRQGTFLCTGLDRMGAGVDEKTPQISDFYKKIVVGYCIFADNVV